MRDLDSLALYDALPPDERAALDAALADRPALAEAFARWRSLKAEVRADLARDLPDRTLLVLYALADDDLLSEAERETVESARADLDAAVARHPGLAAAVRRIQADRDAFEMAWAEAARASEEAPAAVPSLAPTRPPRAADRPAVRRARPTRWVSRVAMIVGVVAFAAILTTLFLRDAGWETVVASERQTVTFDDGSTVQLAAGTRLMVPEGDDARRARLLGGQALFRIVRNPAEPFEVTTPNAEVTVLGTTFSVDATDVETEVVLVSGAVTLAPRATPDEAVRLAPGEISRVLALDAPSAPEPANVGAALAWTGTVFAPRGETVGFVVEQLGRRFGASVTVDSALAGEVVVGEFGGDDLRGALDQLAMALRGADLDARVVEDGTGFRVVE